VRGGYRQRTAPVTRACRTPRASSQHAGLRRALPQQVRERLQAPAAWRAPSRLRRSSVRPPWSPAGAAGSGDSGTRKRPHSSTAATHASAMSSARCATPRAGACRPWLRLRSSPVMRGAPPRYACVRGAPRSPGVRQMFRWLCWQRMRLDASGGQQHAKSAPRD